jgi:hypothetical protein
MGNNDSKKSKEDPKAIQNEIRRKSDPRGVEAEKKKANEDYHGAFGAHYDLQGGYK